MRKSKGKERLGRGRCIKDSLVLLQLRMKKVLMYLGEENLCVLKLGFGGLVWVICWDRERTKLSWMPWDVAARLGASLDVHCKARLYRLEKLERVVCAHEGEEWAEILAEDIGELWHGLCTLTGVGVVVGSI